MQTDCAIRSARSSGAAGYAGYAGYAGLAGASLLALVCALGGCALPDNASERLSVEGSTRGSQGPADAGRPRTAQPQSLLEPQYLRYKAEDTQLTGAGDDGRITYLEFAAPLATEPELFDQEGRALATASVGRVVAVMGLQGGILVRRADRASFVSPNARAASSPRAPLQETTDHAEARARLENQHAQMLAMQRAVEAARPGPAGGTADNRAAAPWMPALSVQPLPALPSPPPIPFQAATPPSMQPTLQPTLQAQPLQQPQAQPLTYESNQASRTRQLMQLLRSLQGEALASASAPLATANAYASVPERGLVRVFFATASRAIVAPDDGLDLLLREAVNADQIRITGYTDATGSRASNDALAQARADAVVQILLRRGVPRERIVSNAIGAEEYIADNTSDRGRALNRRAEVLLMRSGRPLALGPEQRLAR
jgi:flagellar motor protein MotB